MERDDSFERSWRGTLVKRKREEIEKKRDSNKLGRGYAVWEIEQCKYVQMYIEKYRFFQQ